MDKRIAIPAGLALLVALAVLGMVSFFSLTATQLAEASNFIPQIDQARVDLDRLNKPESEPIQYTAGVTGAKVSASPRDPGDNTRLTVTFTLTDFDMVNGRDEVVIQAKADDWADTFPTTISPSNVTISSDSVTNTANAGGPGEAVEPQEVTIDFVGTENDLVEITILVPDMSSDDNSGGNGIAVGGKVTVVFRQSAGIRLPFEADDWKFDISTIIDGTKTTEVDNETLKTLIVLELSDVKDDRGKGITAIIKGIKGGTVTFWLDKNGNNKRDSGEIDLCNGSEDDKAATCDFTVQNPPFHPTKVLPDVASGSRVNGDVLGAATEITVDDGTDFEVDQNILVSAAEKMRITAIAGNVLTVTRGIDDTTRVFHADDAGISITSSCDAGIISGCNYINAIDGESKTLALTTTATSQSVVDRTVFNLTGGVKVNPDEGDPGDAVTVTVKDYPAGNLTKVLVAGVAVTTTSDGTLITSLTVPASGELNFTIDIPDGVPTGEQVLFVFDFNDDDENTSLIVGSARMTVTPSSVVPNMRVSIIGTGFTDGGAATINKSGDGSTVTLGGEVIHTSKVNDGKQIDVDDGGSWSASIDLPVTNASTTEGARELKIIDSAGREGKVDLIFPDRVITITPPEGRVSSNVTVRGNGFPAKNNDGNSITIDVDYTAGDDINSATATPDASGNFSVTLQVPSDAPIPSTNTVKASFDAFKTNTKSDKTGIAAVVTTVTHRVPEAILILNKISGAPGTKVSAEGEGFKRFTPLTTLEVGDIDVTPSPKPATDAQGNLSFEFIIPGSDTGVQTVEMDVGGTTASVGFVVTDDSGFGDGVVTPIEDALEPLFDSGTFDSAFFFNNGTKEFDFFINDDDFLDVNDLLEVPSGAPLWLQVTEDTTVTLNNQVFDLTCVNAGTPEEDCFNLIVFP